MGKRMTIKDIARLAGVSVGAVSTAFSKKSSNVHLSEATREKIFQVARENHYIPNIAARSMQTRKSYLLGFFYRMDNAYLQAQILRGIREICMKHEYDIIVYPCESLEDERYYLETLHVNQLDGIITIPILENGKTNEMLYRRLADRGIPVIQILADLWKDLAMIGRDYPYIGYQSVKQLYAKGHRYIGALMFHNYNDPKTGLNSTLLMEGIQQGVKEFNLKLEIYPLEKRADSQYYFHEAERAAEKILQSPEHPTALIAASGRLAYGAYSCLTRHGLRVPEDISLLACGDDSEQFSQLALNLSYFSVELEKIGILSARYCLERDQEYPLKQLLVSPFREGDTIAELR